MQPVAAHYPAHPLLVRWAFMPTEVRQALRPLLAHCICLVPGWCHSLLIGFDADVGGGTAASMTPAPEYRTATLYLYPRWLSQSPPERERILRHEFIHLLTDPLKVEAITIAENFISITEQKAAYLYATEQIRQRAEGVTQDINRMLGLLPLAALPLVAFAEEEDEQAPLGPGADLKAVASAGNA